jgi:hypothetical protein
MAKFNNMKGLLDELERLYDGTSDLEYQNYLLDKVTGLWSARAPLELMMGYMGGLVETSRELHTKTIIELDKAVDLLKNWHKLDKQEANIIKKEEK